MKDLVTKGTGNSRYMKSAIGASETWEQAREKLRNGTFPFDLNGLNEAGIEQMGMALSKQNLLADDTAAALGLSGDPTVDDAFEILAPSVEDQTKVGDIKTTTRTDLGDKWILCNGEGITNIEYPELVDYLTGQLNNIRVLDVAKPVSAVSEKGVYIANNKLIVVLGLTNDWNDQPGYVYHTEIGKNEWKKSNNTIDINSYSHPLNFCRYINGVYYICRSTVRPKTGTTSAVFDMYLYKSTDLINWEPFTITINYASTLTSTSSGTTFCLGTILYNEETEKYCVAFHTYENYGSTETGYAYIAFGNLVDGNIIATTNQLGENWSRSISPGSDPMRFHEQARSVGKYFVFPKYTESGTSDVYFFDSTLDPPGSSTPISCSTSSAQLFSYGSFPCMIDGTICLISNKGMIKFSENSEGITYEGRNLDQTVCSFYAPEIFLDEENKTIYMFSTSFVDGNNIHKYIFESIEDGSEFVKEEHARLLPNSQYYATGVSQSGFVTRTSSNGTIFYVASPLDVYALPNISFDGAYAYIKAKE